MSAAALALFVEKGFAATRLDEIAARAGVSKGTLYLYFDSKEALFEAAIRDGILPLVEAVEAQAERLAGDPERILREILNRWWAGVVATDLGGIPKLMLAEAASFPAVARFFYENVVERGRRLIRAALECGVQSGQFRPLDMEIATSLFFVPVLHVATCGQSLAFSDACVHEPRAFLENHLEIYLRGIRAEKKGCSR